MDGDLRLCILIIHPKKSCSLTFENQDLSQSKYSGEETPIVKTMNGWVGAVRIAVSPGVVSSLVTLLDNERDRENTQWEGGVFFMLPI